MPEYEHMPFVTVDFNGVETRFFAGRSRADAAWHLWKMRGCLKEPVNTGLPKNWNICCPTAEYDDGQMHITFIAGPPEGPNALYEMTDLLAPKKLADNVDVGFARWNWLVTGTRHGPIYVEHAGIRKTITIDGLDYLYRVSYDTTCPSVLLVTASIGHNDTLLAIPYDGSQPLEINTQVGLCPYKGVRTPAHEIMYALRLGTQEERIIALEKQPVETPYHGAVRIETVDETATKACPRCFKKHISLALNYAKEIVAGHGANAALDHSADLSAALTGAEEHAAAMEIQGYIDALRKLRHELDATGYVPTTAHIDTLRRLFRSASNLPPCNCSKKH